MQEKIDTNIAGLTLNLDLLYVILNQAIFEL